jgi:ABC-type Fe3+-hydroxamate transport system substrate-binding protein
MPFFTDQTGRYIQLQAPARRIVSLVPSLTNTLHQLGLEDEVVGITRFCVHPDSWYRTKTRIGGTKDVHIDQVLQQQPDLVLANKEENVKEQIDTLNLQVPVWTSDISNMADTVHMIHALGQLTGKTAESMQLVSRIETAFASLPAPIRRYRSLYLIWRNPYMAAGGDTFIHQMLQAGGFDNVLVDETRYPSLSSEQIQELQPDLLFLSSEPYPFKAIHAEELQQLLPQTRILFVNGEVFSWYGASLLHTPEYLMQLQKDVISFK